ncbi:MAG: alpha/beta hydrolase [Clostridia bacterium]|nr:alpha/beta hydrolase [Clostridia bacterium]
MKLNTFVLDNRYQDATLTTFLHDDSYCPNNPPRPAMIVCPGGGYHALTPKEGEPIALYYFNAGMNVFLLRYSICGNAASYAPLIESALTVKHIRENAQAYNVDPHKVLICGFSAGGHLAGSCGILWNAEPVRKALGDAPEGIGRPDGVIMSYAVVTGMEHRHKNSFRYLTGKDEPTDEERLPFSLEHHVDSTTPPIFLWHTCNDAIVPIMNAVLLQEALCRNGIPFEAHVFPKGPHGLALANADCSNGDPKKDDPHVASWAKLSLEWANHIFAERANKE